MRHNTASPVDRAVVSRRQSGLTLFELLVALLIAALILGLGSPTFSEFRRNNRLTGIANDLLGSVQVARSEAVKRQTTVSICPTGPVGAEDPACTDQPDFAGWLVFADPDRDCRPASDADVIQAHKPVDPDEAGRIAVRSDGTCIGFGANGFLNVDGGLALADAILVCDRFGIADRHGVNQSAARGVEVSETGRVSVTRRTDRIAAWGIPCPPAS